MINLRNNPKMKFFRKVQSLWVYFIMVLETQTDSGTARGDEFIVACYWHSQSHWRIEGGKFQVNGIDPLLCTHLMYSYAGVHEDSFKIYSLDPFLDFAQGEIEEHADDPWNSEGELDMIRKSVKLKELNPDMKVLISVGGEDQGFKRFSKMMAKSESRKIFITSAIEFITTFNLDGIDLAIRIETMDEFGPNDKMNFQFLLEELRMAMDGRDDKKLLLSTVLNGDRAVIDKAYNIPGIMKSCDFVGVSSFDLRKYSDVTKKIVHHSPLYPKASESEDEKSFSVIRLIQKILKTEGTVRKKIVIGIASYGRTYTMYNEAAYNFYDESSGPGVPGPFTQTEGLLSTNELCHSLIQNPEDWNFFYDHEYKAPYGFRMDKLWIGYDNQISAQEKVDFLVKEDLGGVMLFTIDMDDFDNVCQNWRRFPILQAINDRLEYHSEK